jgi:hypothetical protein
MLATATATATATTARGNAARTKVRAARGNDRSRLLRPDRVILNASMRNAKTLGERMMMKMKMLTTMTMTMNETKKKKGKNAMMMMMQMFSNKTMIMRRSTVITNANRNQSDDQNNNRKKGENMQDVAALDGLINQLLNAREQSEERLQKICIENIMAFDQRMWLRMANRTDTANTEREKENVIEVIQKCMKIIEATLRKAEETIDRSSEKLQRVVSASANEVTNEFDVPLNADALRRMEREVKALEVDEGMLNTAYAWIRKADEDKMDGMVHILQKFLQVYASVELNKNKSQLDEILGCANTDEWPIVFQKLVDEGYGEVAFTKELQQRMEEVVLQLTNGSYSQRVQAEYLKEVEERSKEYFK